MFLDRHTRPSPAFRRGCRAGRLPPAAGRATDNWRRIFPAAFRLSFRSRTNKDLLLRKPRRFGQRTFSCSSLIFESIPFYLLKVEFFIAPDNLFCHVSPRYCDVVIRPETAVAHDSAPAGRVIADLFAHVARARRL